MYNSTGWSVLLVAVFHVGINAMGVYRPADPEMLAPGGIPDPWLNFLAEVTGAIPLVAVALLIVIVFGTARLANHEVPGPEIVGLR